MASLLESDVVNYVCDCGHLNPVSKLYFCRYCLKLRCGYCVCSQVDSYFCSNCLENIPSAEAKFKKNRCNKCFDCPSCQHSLTSRANTVQVVATAVNKADDASSPPAAAAASKSPKEAKPLARKMYYLMCLACRWTSRDVGIPDQTVATGQWSDLEYAHANRFAMLLENCQNVVLHDKQEKQDFMRRKAPKPHKYPSLTDRTGVTVSMARRTLGWSDKTAPKNMKVPLPTITASVASADVDELPEHFFKEPLVLDTVTTLRQRLNNPAVQPVSVNDLHPHHKSLSIKRSLRCRQCEHYVVKPEFNPNSIKYRIHSLANYHVPEVRLLRKYILKAGQSTQIQVKFINPTMHDMTIAIAELPTSAKEHDEIAALQTKFNQQLNTGTPQATSSPFNTIAPTAGHVQVPKPVNVQLTGTVQLPDEPFVVHRRDDTTEFDAELKIQNEPRFVMWPRSNKVAIELTVHPLDAKPGDDVVVGFRIEHNYKNTFPNTTDKKEPQEHLLTSRVYLKVGTIQ